MVLRDRSCSSCWSYLVEGGCEEGQERVMRAQEPFTDSIQLHCAGRMVEGAKTVDGESCARSFPRARLALASLQIEAQIVLALRSSIHLTLALWD